MLSVYIDGSCSPNPGKGGWAVVVVQDNDVQLRRTGNMPDTTNNRCELTAALVALDVLADYYPTTPAVIYTDSQYIERGINEWLDGWRAHWRTNTGKVVANQDLWQQVNLPEHVEVRWVRGHGTNRWNLYVDELAVAARSQNYK